VRPSTEIFVDHMGVSILNVEYAGLLAERTLFVSVFGLLVS